MMNGFEPLSASNFQHDFKKNLYLFLLTFIEIKRRYIISLTLEKPRAIASRQKILTYYNT